METPSAHTHAARLKIALLAVLALGIGWAIYALYQLGASVMADFENLAGQDWIDALVWLLLIPALGKLFLVLLKAPWGKDFTWTDGQWRDTEPLALRAGAGLPLAEPLREPVGSFKGGLLVMTVISLMVLVSAVGAFDSPADWLGDDAAFSPLMLLPPLGALIFVSVVAYAGTTVLTRRVQFDDTGVCDANFFRSQRIPWRVVAQFRLLDASDSSTEPDGSTRQAHASWVLKDAQGHTLMTLDPAMTPQASLQALRARLESRIGAGSASGAADFGNPDSETINSDPTLGRQAQADPEHANATNRMQAEMDRAQRAHAKQFAEMDRGFNRTVLISLSLVLALFLVPTIMTTYTALWFKLAATQTVGVVVELPEGSLPSLVVQYQVGGAEPLRISSDGSDAYADYKVGDKVGVFYDPDQPEDARLDLFLELWIGPIILGSLALIMALITAVIARSFKPRRVA